MNNHVQYICDVESYKRLGYNNVLFNILLAYIKESIYKNLL